VTLEVRPLPPNPPPGFESVNVGSLSLQLAPSEPAVPAGEPLALRLTARGSGNIRAWSLPSLPPIAGTRRFEPTSSEQLAPASGRIAGSRTLETLVVPERAGELVVPPLSLPWFDVKAGRYQVARTAELRIPVSAGRGLPALAAGAGVGTLVAELRPIRSGEALARSAAPPWRRPLFILLVLLPPAGLAALLASDRLRERARLGAPARRVRGAVRAARRRLSAAGRRLTAGDSAGFVAEIERTLTGYAADKLGFPVTGLTRDLLASSLTASGAHPPAVRSLLATLEACDAARFGGSPPGAPLLATATETMALLEEADWAPGAGVRT
jgi:hypothetical protein